MASDSQLRVSGFGDPALPCRILDKFVLHCSRSLSSMNEYLVVDTGGCLYKKLSSRVNYNVTECFPEKSR